MMLYQVLTNRRVELKMSMDELAAKSGVSKSTLSKIMCGKTANPQIETLKPIAYALDMTLAEIGMQEEKSSVSLSPEAIRIARIYDNSNDKIKAAFEAVAAITEA